jgi:hypothetical protein
MTAAVESSRAWFRWPLALGVSLVTNGEHGRVVQGIKAECDPIEHEILIEKAPAPGVWLTVPPAGPVLKEIRSTRELAAQRREEFLSGAWIANPNGGGSTSCSSTTRPTRQRSSVCPLDRTSSTSIGESPDFPRLERGHFDFSCRHCPASRWCQPARSGYVKT